MIQSQPISICLVRTSALGDLFLLLPAVQSLCDALPDAKITWIIDQKFMPVVQHLDGRVHFYTVNGPKRIADYYRIWQDFKGQQFDVLLAMQAKLRSNLIYPLIGAKRKIGFDSLRAKDLQHLVVNEQITYQEQHLADGFFSFLAHLGIEHKAPQWAPTLLESAIAWRQKTMGEAPYFVFNTASSKLERDWPKAMQVEYFSRLSTLGWQGRVAITGSDVAHGDALAALIPGAVNLVGKTDLPQLFALLAGARFLISPDSGPVHIAQAYKVPVIGLYAVVRSQLSGPWQAQQYCIDVYHDAVKTLLHRDPTQLGWHHRVHDVNAMALISVDAVLAQTSRVIADVA